MKFPIFLLVVTTLITGCNSGVGGMKLGIDNNPLGDHDTKNLPKLNDEQRSNFYRLWAPISDMNKAANTLSPSSKEDAKAKTTAMQTKMSQDLKDRCLVKPVDKEKPSEDLQYQTFKESFAVESTDKTDKKPCPINLDQEITISKDVPALAETPKRSREVKANVQVSWKKHDEKYKELGQLLELAMKGSALTYWLKDTAKPQVNVEEQYELSITTKNEGTIPGLYRVLKSYTLDYDLDAKGDKLRQTRWELIVTRILLKIPNLPAEGKLIVMNKQIYSEKEKRWITEITRRNALYFNSVALTDEDVAKYEKARNEALGN